ncbi:MAG: ceramidase domain-containing protein [bacterium]
MKFFFSSFITFLVITGAAVVLGRVDYSWTSWKPASCMPVNCFCETIHRGTVAQPANTWSSFAFVFAGLLIIRQSGEDVRSRRLNMMTSRRAYPLLYGAALVLLGLGSAFYHASLTFAGQFADLMGMYLLACFILLYNVSRLKALNAKTFVWAYLALNLALTYVLLEFPALRRYIFAAIVIAALLPEYGVRRQKKPQINGFFLQAAWWALIIAFVIWTLDITKVLCNPNSWLQGHALWHILGALAAGLLYLYYRSENAVSPQIASGPSGR